jgi:hypothetical protein
MPESSAPYMGMVCLGRTRVVSKCEFNVFLSPGGREENETSLDTPKLLLLVPTNLERLYAMKGICIFEDTMNY